MDEITTVERHLLAMDKWLLVYRCRFTTIALMEEIMGMLLAERLWSSAHVVYQGRLAGRAKMLISWKM